MDPPARFGFGHPLHAMDAGFVFQPGEDALALDPDRGFLDPAQFGFRQFQHLEIPALPLGIAAIHRQKVAREQGGFLAPGSGTNFDEGGAGVGGVFRQQRDAQSLFQIGQRGFQAADFILGQFAHVGIGQHQLRLGQTVAGSAPFGDLGDDGAQIGIFAADRGDFIGRGAGIQLCFEKLETLGDLDQAVFGQHSREVPAASWHVKAI